MSSSLFLWELTKFNFKNNSLAYWWKNLTSKLGDNSKISKSYLFPGVSPLKLKVRQEQEFVQICGLRGSSPCIPFSTWKDLVLQCSYSSNSLNAAKTVSWKIYRIYWYFRYKSTCFINFYTSWIIMNPPKVCSYFITCIVIITFSCVLGHPEYLSVHCSYLQVGGYIFLQIVFGAGVISITGKNLTQPYLLNSWRGHFEKKNIKKFNECSWRRWGRI